MLLASFRIGCGRKWRPKLTDGVQLAHAPDKWRPSMKADAVLASTCSLLHVLVSRAGRIPLNTRSCRDFRRAIYKPVPIEMVIPFFQRLE